MTPLLAQRLLLGAVIRGTLRPRDLRDLAAGWWRLPPVEVRPIVLGRSPGRTLTGREGGAYQAVLAELHGSILAAWEASTEARRGRPRLDDIGVALGAEARRYAVALSKVEPERGVRESKRDAALRALGVVRWHAARLREAEGEAQGVVRAVAGSRLVRAAAERYSVGVSGMMIITACGGVPPDL